MTIKQICYLGKRHGELLIQPLAPVYAIIYEDSLGQLTDQIAQEICVNYGSTLQFFIQKNLERSYRSKKFYERADIPAVGVLSGCTNLKLFALRERISYGTALLLALIAKSQNTTLCLRRNAILKRMNWSESLVNSKVGEKIVDYNWLRIQCKNYGDLENTMSTLTNSTATVVNDNRYLFLFR
ncbi:unnamed protein product [Enterobius vermicularis]|uniref:Uncharacterized protein n=1 Tax=Enterobius vermicularis TaxID=51028 RepID=A0A3P6IBZ8_ENTVE|nr:unnamed protein product [Enterobius vermicularis]